MSSIERFKKSLKPQLSPKPQLEESVQRKKNPTTGADTRKAFGQVSSSDVDNRSNRRKKERADEQDRQEALKKFSSKSSSKKREVAVKTQGEEFFVEEEAPHRQPGMFGNAKVANSFARSSPKMSPHIQEIVNVVQERKKSIEMWEKVNNNNNNNNNNDLMTDEEEEEEKKLFRVISSDEWIE